VTSPPFSDFRRDLSPFPPMIVQEPLSFNKGPCTPPNEDLQFGRPGGRVVVPGFFFFDDSCPKRSWSGPQTTCWKRGRLSLTLKLSSFSPNLCVSGLPSDFANCLIFRISFSHSQLPPHQLDQILCLLPPFSQKTIPFLLLLKVITDS